MKVKRLRRPSKALAHDLSLLYRQLSPEGRPISTSYLARAFQDKDTYVIAIIDRGHAVGTGTLILAYLISGLRADIHHVIIDANFRGKGLGELVVRSLIKIAKSRKAKYVDLTSAPQHIAAQGLYGKLGFKKRDTNVFRLTL